MKNIKALLGENIKKNRANLGLTQAQMAEKAKMATNYLGLIESGKKFPSAEMIERIAASLGIDTIDLFTIAPIQKDWKEKVLLRIRDMVDEELEAQLKEETRLNKLILENLAKVKV